MSKEGDKFFTMQLYRGSGQVVPVAIWNGVKHYSNSVPPALLDYMQSRTTGTQFAIHQVPYRESYKSIRHSRFEPYDGVIFWTRDTKTYKSLVKELRTYSVCADLEPLDEEEDAS